MLDQYITSFLCFDFDFYWKKEQNNGISWIWIGLKKKHLSKLLRNQKESNIYDWHILVVYCGIRFVISKLEGMLIVNWNDGYHNKKIPCHQTRNELWTWFKILFIASKSCFFLQSTTPRSSKSIFWRLPQPVQVKEPCCYFSAFYCSVSHKSVILTMYI